MSGDLTCAAAAWLTWKMANQTPTSQVPTTPLYMLVAEKLGRDPIEMIRERRNETPPVPFTKIRDELMKTTQVYLTHEAPRRWLRQADEAQQQAA